VSKVAADSLNENHRHRLREKFLRSEFGAFVDHEIIELMLTLSIPRKDVKGIAKILLRTFGSIRGIFDAEIADLMRVKGIGEATAVSLKIIPAMNNLYLQKCCEDGFQLDSVEKIGRLWRHRLSSLRIEVFEVAYLNSSLQLLPDGIERMESGTVTTAVVCPRKVAESAIRRNSTAILIAHNHPSGAAEPSDQDERTTKFLKSVLQPLGIRLIDHLIISPDASFSFLDHGMI
jgi:DNA repair protein RadC